MTAMRAVARGLGSRRRRLGVGWLEAGRGRTRARGAIIARSARFLARSCARSAAATASTTRSRPASAPLPALGAFCTRRSLRSLGALCARSTLALLARRSPRSLGARCARSALAALARRMLRSRGASCHSSRVCACATSSNWRCGSVTHAACAHAPRQAIGVVVASRRRLLGVGWLEAGRRRTRARGAIIAHSARFLARSCARSAAATASTTRSRSASAPLPALGAFCTRRSLRSLGARYARSALAMLARRSPRSLGARCARSALAALAWR